MDQALVEAVIQEVQAKVLTGILQGLEWAREITATLEWETLGVEWDRGP